MRRKFALLAVAAAVGGLAGCDRPEVDQIAQRWLIGVSQKHIRACWGEPLHRRQVGLEQIWTYRIGASRTRDWIPGEPSPPDGRCDVNLVVDRYGVHQIYYTGTDGRSLPLGQVCEYPVEACAAPR